MDPRYPTSTPGEIKAAKDREREHVATSKTLLQRLCGIVYATRDEQRRLNYIDDQEYANLVRLRHSGCDAIQTVTAALSRPQIPSSPEVNDATDGLYGTQRMEEL